MMKRPISLALSALTLTASLAHAQEEALPQAPSNEKLIELQTTQGMKRAMEKILNIESEWGIFDKFKPNRCKYAIQVPDSVTRGTIALTFDDGPNPDTTPLILDVLKAHNAKGTFFILGSKIKGNEAILRRMVAEGHQLANHSYSHPNFHELSSSRMNSEIKTTDRLLRTVGTPRFFRYPYGNSTCSSNELVSSLGYVNVGWDIDTCDWAFADGQVSDKENATCQAPQHLRRDYAGYVANVVAQTQGGVLLMHDIHKNTAHSLDRLMTMLEQDGYRFVSLTDRNIFPKLNRR
ncbi:putative peptidoglycan GlcNAc deacetylase [Bdellovibrio bacteriovorus HD100]|uniref:Putative peptidoglycan GlcNAc deacetylase n=2 Tax=Bdellovibrio bacteriovorus TaxID=959 RepID=Q6MQJ8_BDEBA|nr:putative peptidoglycan GlcNAc deacetylase [Bdellovibrio bacteriovorus HD100]